MSVKAQGSQLYVLHEGAIVAITCIDAITLGGNPRDQLEDTCLEETEARSYQQGLGTPAAASVPIKPDPSNPGHILLEQLSISGDVVQWALGWSDGKDIAPTVAAGDFVLPATRTWCVFEGYVSDFPFDFAANSLVTGAVAIQRSGGTRWVRKNP